MICGTLIIMPKLNTYNIPIRNDIVCNIPYIKGLSKERSKIIIEKVLIHIQ